MSREDYYMDERPGELLPNLLQIKGFFSVNGEFMYISIIILGKYVRALQHVKLV